MEAKVQEIGWSLMAGAMLAWITLRYWYIAAIIIIAVGYFVSKKVENSKLIMGIFIEIAIFISIVGIVTVKESEDTTESAYNFEIVNEVINV